MLRYVVICPQGLGDSLVATPMVAALREARPDSQITVIVMREAPRLLFSGMPELVDRVVYLPYWAKGAGAFAREALRLPFAERAQSSFMTYPSARAQYALLAGLVRAERHYTHDYPAARKITKYRRNVRAVPIALKQNVFRNMDLLKAAGIKFRSPDSYVVPASWKGNERNHRRIVLHIGSIAHDGFDSKRWPERSFIELAQRLVARGFELVLLSGPEERVATQRVHAAVRGATYFEERLSDAAKLIAGAAALVANDNGMAHLAAGVGTPVLALFGPTPLEHKPFGSNVFALRPSLCPPCFTPLLTATSCVRNIDYQCLKQDLTVDVAEKAVLALLKGSALHEDLTLPSARPSGSNL